MASYSPRTSKRSGPGSAGALRTVRFVTQVCAMSDLQHRPDDMIHVRLPAELRAAVERVAQEENRTLSGQVRHIIARAVTKPRQEGATA
jgi:CopG-like RHH_1 or ribbon-helix-helix domain, RHH_5